jgi:hypothetical protein
LQYNWNSIETAAFHDKKADGGIVSVISVDEVGSFNIKSLECSDVINMAKNVLEGMKI